MAIVTLGELMDRGRAFETRLAEYYAEVRDRTTDNGVRLLTYYLARHRRHQDEALESLTPAMAKRVRKVELKFDVPLEDATSFRLPPFDPAAATGDELIRAAIAYDTELVEFYRSILAQPANDEVRGVLEALIRFEERDIVMLKKMQAMHYF